MSSSIRLHLRLDEYSEVVNLLHSHGQTIAASMAILQAPASALSSALSNFEVNEASLVVMGALMSMADAAGPPLDGSSEEASQEPLHRDETDSPLWPRELLQECLNLGVEAHPLLLNNWAQVEGPPDEHQVQSASAYIKKVTELVTSMLSNFDMLPRELGHRRPYYEGLFGHLGLLPQCTAEPRKRQADRAFALEVCAIKFTVLGEAVEHLIDV